MMKKVEEMEEIGTHRILMKLVGMEVLKNYEI